MLNLIAYKSKWHVLLSDTMVMPSPGKQLETMSESKALLQPESVLISVPPVAIRTMWRPEVRATTWGHVCAQRLHYHWDNPDLAGIHQPPAEVMGMFRHMLLLRTMGGSVVLLCPVSVLKPLSNVATRGHMEDHSLGHNL